MIKSNNNRSVPFNNRLVNTNNRTVPLHIYEELRRLVYFKGSLENSFYSNILQKNHTHLTFGQSKKNDLL